MVGIRVRGWVIHYIHEGPHKEVQGPYFSIPSFLPVATVVVAGRPGAVNWWREKREESEADEGRQKRQKKTTKHGQARYIREERKDTWFSSE